MASMREQSSVTVRSFAPELVPHLDHVRHPCLGIVLDQLGAQPAQPEAEPALDGADRHLLRLRDLLGGVPAQDRQQHGASLRVGQRADRGTDPTHLGEIDGTVLRVHAPRRRQHRGELVGVERRRLPEPEGVDGQPATDRHDPGAHRGATAVECAGVPPGTLERLLGDVLRQRAITDHGHGQAVHLPLEAPHEDRARLGLAGGDRGQEGLVAESVRSGGPQNHHSNLRARRQQGSRKPTDGPRP